MAIRILITGGTIDCQYDPLTSTNIIPNSLVPEMLKQAKCTVDVVQETLFLKGSREILEEDRKKILEKCQKCDEEQIIITHGTYTIPETAQLLGKNITNKTIILLGSMIPFSYGNSDALFNLGSALTAVQLLKNGVYVTMNGKVFNWNNVRKNTEKGVFEELQ